MAHPAIRTFACDQRVYTPRGNGVVEFIDHNPRTCMLCRDITCVKVDVRLDDATTVTHRACELAKPLDHDGDTIAANAGPVVVAVQCIRPGAAYRLSIRHADLVGAEIDELSRSFPAESTARRAARTATALFRSGLTVQQAIDLLGVFSIPR